MNRISKSLFLAFLVLLITIPVLSLFHPGLPWGHDAQDHTVRIANFYQNLSEGNIIPRWAGNLNWGYGHPILEFLYPLPSYIASFFHLVGFTFADSLKIVFALGMILSFIFMYLWLSSFVSRTAGLFGAVLYTYAPYRFVELYVRGDIGEHLAFVFIPLALFYIYRIYKKNHFIDVILGSFSLACLILSHNAISLMIMPFIIVYCVLLIYFSKDKNKISINLIFLLVMGFGLSAFFWIPGLLEGKYTLRDIITKGEYLTRFVSIRDLIYGPWNYGGSGEFTVQLGLFQWISLILSPAIFVKFKKNKEKFYLALILIAYSIFAIFLMLPISNIVWSRIMLLQNFQFPWRFLAMVVFSTSILGALLMEIIPEKLKLKVCVISIVLIFIISSFYWKPKGYLHKPESFYTGIYKGTTDTGESAPVWSVRFMEKIPPSYLEVIDGYADIKNITRKSTYHKYYIVVYKKTLFRENTLYFPGWEIRANNKPVRVEFQNMTYRGIMLFTLPPGSYNVEVAYKETKLRLFANIITFVSLGSAMGGVIFILLIKLRYKKNL